MANETPTETEDVRIARLEEKYTALENEYNRRVSDLEETLGIDKVVTHKEFDPIKRAVYASVSGILITVLVALIVLSTT